MANVPRHPADDLIEHYRLSALANYFSERAEELVVSLASAHEAAFPGIDHKPFVLASIKILFTQHPECLDFIDRVTDVQRRDYVLLIVAGKIYDIGIELIRNNSNNPENS